MGIFKKLINKVLNAEVPLVIERFVTKGLAKKEYTEEQAAGENLNPSDTSPFSMVIEDVFAISGMGTVATGKIQTGSIKQNEKITIIGGEQYQDAIVISIEKFNKIVSAAEAGEDVGLLLKNLNINAVKKGYVVVKAGENYNSLDIHPQIRNESGVVISSMKIAEAKKILPVGIANDLWNRIPDDVKALLFYTHETPKLENHTGLNTITMGFGGKDFFNKIENQTRLNTITMGSSEKNFFNIEYNDHVHNDPSTIYFKLPLKIPEDISSIGKLPYMPSYALITPEQRYIYLNWLQDVSRDIEVGYKFMFYYGLERMLLIGDREKAFDMIVRLRRNTDNGSFQAYSSNALFYTTILVKKEITLDKLDFLFEDKVWYDKQVMLKFFKEEPVEPHEVTNILKGLGVNKRYLDEKIYVEQLGELLSEKYGHSYLVPQDIINDDLSAEKDIPVFANFSFPPEIRIAAKIALPELSRFFSTITDLHTICHERTKEKLAQNRKKK
jgi:hypothetical protein